ncbi:MAG: nucleotidyltransferase domain-containing protein, partial [Spirochaetia bacterium]
PRSLMDRTLTSCARGRFNVRRAGEPVKAQVKAQNSFLVILQEIIYNQRMTFNEIDPRFRDDVETAVKYLNSVGCTEIYIFGSLYTGQIHSNSDIDIAVRGLKPEDFFSVYGELLTRLKHSVDLVDLDLQEQFGKSLIKTGNYSRVA